MLQKIKDNEPGVIPLAVTAKQPLDVFLPIEKLDGSGEYALLSDHLVIPEEPHVLTDAEIRADEVLAKHADWLAAFRDKYTFTAENAADLIRAEVGETFVHVLEDAGVYKDTEAMLRFTASIGAKA